MRETSFASALVFIAAATIVIWLPASALKPWHGGHPITIWLTRTTQADSPVYT
jgi:hypothetical protein